VPKANVTTTVRKPAAGVGIIDIHGEVNGAAEDALIQAYAQATSGGERVVLINFAGLDYMNSSGIGLLIMLLIRANRAKVKMMACNLSDHYQQIFSLTRLDEAISIHASEAEALAVA
jgi:anti-sigma B factor antagonist